MIYTHTYMQCNIPVVSVSSFLQVVADLLSTVLDERNAPSFAVTSQVMNTDNARNTPVTCMYNVDIIYVCICPLIQTNIQIFLLYTHLLIS